jgi:probable HAF family extracellular repeat protein
MPFPARRLPTHQGEEPLFIDATNNEEVILIDASNLGEKVKEGKNQKTVLRTEEEQQIIETFNAKKLSRTSQWQFPTNRLRKGITHWVLASISTLRSNTWILVRRSVRSLIQVSTMGFLPRFTLSPLARGVLSMRNPILRFAVTVTCLVLCSVPYQDQAEGYTFTSIDFPGAFTGASNSSANGINDGGQIVGTYNDATGSHGYLDSGGSFTSINVPVPGATETFASGVNAGGQIVGSYDDATGRGHGYLDSGGSFTLINVPGALKTSATGINDGGQIVGSYDDVATGSHGYLDSGGGFTSITVPGAFDTTPTGINAGGQIVGTSNYGIHGFLYSGGSFTPINIPGTLNTSPNGINAGGQIVGSYDDVATGFHGFLATAPEPSSLLLLGSGLVGLAAWRWKHAA